MAIETGGHIYNRELSLIMNQKQIGGPFFFHGTTQLPPDVMLPEAVFPAPLYQSLKEAADSGLTCNDNNRKRSRECYAMPDDDSVAASQMPRLFSLLEREAAAQIHHQQREFDCLIALHTQRLKVELEERAKQRSKVLVTAVRAAVEAKMREKDEEIERLSKINWELQERVRSLCIENHLWKGIAQSNEAAANSLRTDLERILTSPGIVEDRKWQEEEEDAKSCCGSSEEGGDGCRGCGGRREVGVLVMPCRHLCLCTTCGSSRESCPVCGSNITASLHVNFSSS